MRKNSENEVNQTNILESSEDSSLNNLRSQGGSASRQAFLERENSKYFSILLLVF